MSSSYSIPFGLRRPPSSRRVSGKVRRDRRFALRPETLEERVTPSIGFTVAQIRDAYGLSSLPGFGSGSADGTGQTIALVLPGNDPTIISDLDGFDQGDELDRWIEQ